MALVYRKLIICTSTLFLMNACTLFGPKPAAPDIPFADFGAAYNEKPDFARIEYDYPLAVDDLLKITPENVSVLPQELVDQIYARLSAGPIPDGTFNGDLFFPKGISGKRRTAEVFGGLKGLVLNAKAKKLEALGGLLWKGKVFFREQGILRNRIEDSALLAPLIDGNTDDIQRNEFDDEQTWLLFPAKLFCGQSLLDSRRESIIIDYAFSDEIEGYRERPDYLAGRNGFRIRDEIRMVRPGFYLGRAYLGKSFLLNFTLYRKDSVDQDTNTFVSTGKVTEDCWPGEQIRSNAQVHHMSGNLARILHQYPGA